MFGTEHFRKLPKEQQLNWYNRANQLRRSNVPPAKLTSYEISACVWAGEMMLQLSQQHPPEVFIHLDRFVDLPAWVISLKHQWIERESRKKGIPSFLLPSLLDTGIGPY